MISRKDLVEALRVLHEVDQITKIVSRAKRIDVFYQSKERPDCLLVIPNPPTNNDKRNNTTTSV